MIVSDLMPCREPLAIGKRIGALEIALVHALEAKSVASAACYRCFGGVARPAAAAQEVWL